MDGRWYHTLPALIQSRSLLSTKIIDPCSVVAVWKTTVKNLYGECASLRDEIHTSTAIPSVKSQRLPNHKAKLVPQSRAHAVSSRGLCEQERAVSEANHGVMFLHLKAMY